MYDDIPYVKQLVDKCPFNNPDAYLLASMLNDEYDSLAFAQLTADNTFHKLSWKQEFQTATPTDKDTFYSFIKRNTDYE